MLGGGFLILKKRTKDQNSPFLIFMFGSDSERRVISTPLKGIYLKITRGIRCDLFFTPVPSPTTYGDGYRDLFGQSINDGFC